MARCGDRSFVSRHDRASKTAPRGKGHPLVRPQRVVREGESIILRKVSPYTFPTCSLAPFGSFQLMESANPGETSRLLAADNALAAMAAAGLAGVLAGVAAARFLAARRTSQSKRRGNADGTSEPIETREKRRRAETD